jgi:hypothetical protein
MELKSPIHTPMKKTFSEVADEERESILENSTLIPVDKNQEFKITSDTCSYGNTAMRAESIPSSPIPNEKLSETLILQLQTTPHVSSEQSQSPSQNCQLQGQQIFVSEMFINQRALYLELASRCPADGQSELRKFHLSETSLDIPDLAFSTTSCALVFNSADFWNNLQVKSKS